MIVPRFNEPLQLWLPLALHDLAPTLVTAPRVPTRGRRAENNITQAAKRAWRRGLRVFA